VDFSHRRQQHLKLSSHLNRHILSVLFGDMDSTLELRDRLYYAGAATQPDKIHMDEVNAWLHAVAKPGGFIEALGDGAHSLIFKNGQGTGRNIRVYINAGAAEIRAGRVKTGMAPISTLHVSDHAGIEFKVFREGEDTEASSMGGYPTWALYDPRFETLVRAQLDALCRGREGVPLFREWASKEFSAYAALQVGEELPDGTWTVRTPEEWESFTDDQEPLHPHWLAHPEKLLVLSYEADMLVTTRLRRETPRQSDSRRGRTMPLPRFYGFKNKPKRSLVKALK